MYRLLNQLPDVACERAFLPDDVAAVRKARLPLLTCESERPLAEVDVIAVSVAYELELGGLFDCLALAGLPLLAAERDERHPIVLAGGPLTVSNPLPLGPFVDVVALGEAEETGPRIVAEIIAATDRPALLSRLATWPGVWVPAIHGERLPAIAAADDALLPACSQILTPHTELASMFLIEPERGCSRGCTYCVMRRSTNGGMRLVSPERVMALVPERHGPGAAHLGALGLGRVPAGAGRHGRRTARPRRPPGRRRLRRFPARLRRRAGAARARGGAVAASSSATRRLLVGEAAQLLGDLAGDLPRARQVALLRRHRARDARQATGRHDLAGSSCVLRAGPRIVRARTLLLALVVMVVHAKAHLNRVAAGRVSSRSLLFGQDERADQAD